MKIITQETAASMIRNSNGKLFGVTFVKRGDMKRMKGTPYDRLPKRKMVARRGVSKGVTGAGQGYNPTNHNLITVNEFVTQPETTRGAKGQFAGGGNMGTQFRHIPIEGIQELRMGGVTYQVQ